MADTPFQFRWGNVPEAMELKPFIREVNGAMRQLSHDYQNNLVFRNRAVTISAAWTFTGTVTLTGATITGLTLASVGAGTSPAGTFTFPTLAATVRVTSPLIGTTTATDVVFDRNSVTQLTLGSLLATFAGAVTIASGLLTVASVSGGNRGIAFSGNNVGVFADGTYLYLGDTVGSSAVKVVWATGAVTMGALTVGSATMLATTTTFTNGAGAGAGTLLNAPAAGNPTKWIPVDDNGTQRFIPAW